MNAIELFDKYAGVDVKNKDFPLMDRDHFIKAIAEIISSPVEPEVSVQKELLDEVLDDLLELRGERSWWKDEPRCNYQKEYNELSERIEKLLKILSR